MSATKTGHYVIVRSSERIQITCEKVNNNTFGTLVARVNEQPANKIGDCLNYAPNSNTNDACLKQQFEFYLNSNTPLFDVDCFIMDAADLKTDSVRITLNRLCNYK